MPSAAVALNVLPTLVLWSLGVPLVATGELIGGAIMLAGAAALTVFSIRVSRVGATVDSSGIEIRTFGTTGRLRWQDVERFSVLNMGLGRKALVLNTADGESLPIMGVPNRSYRRQHYQRASVFSSKLVDHVAEDLQGRLRSAQPADR
jgi:Bacterial PH domain